MISKNFHQVIESFRILDSVDRTQVYFLLVLSIVNSLIQTLGIVSIMPFIAIISEPDLVESNQQIILLKEFLGVNSYDSLLLVFGAFTFCSLILSNFFSTFNFWLSLRFFSTKEYILTRDLLDIFLSKKTSAFYKTKKSQILKYILSDVERVITGTQIAIIELISNILICVVVFSLLLYLDVFITLTTTALLGIAYLLIYVVLAEKINVFGKEFARLESKIYAATNHAIDLFREIRISGHKPHFIEQYASPSKKLVVKIFILKYALSNQAIHA